MEIQMLIKLQEAQTISTTTKDPTGRTVAESKVICRDLLVNPEHIVSINEDAETSRNAGENFSRVETTRGVFIVRGSPSDIENKMGFVERPRSVLRG
jgi:hypothetical protein